MIRLRVALASVLHEGPSRSVAAVGFAPWPLTAEAGWELEVPRSLWEELNMPSELELAVWVHTPGRPTLKERA